MIAYPETNAAVGDEKKFDEIVARECQSAFPSNSEGSGKRMTVGPGEVHRRIDGSHRRISAECAVVEIVASQAGAAARDEAKKGDKNDENEHGERE